MLPADLSLWVGVIAPALWVLGLRQREGAPLGRVFSAACRVRAAYSLSSEAPILLPVNNPAMVPASVAAITVVTAIGVLIASDFEWVIRGLPAGQRKPFSRPRPRRPKGPGLILSPARQVLAEAARP